MSKPTFEECLPLIDREIAKRRPKWNLTVLAWLSFEDVSQIIRLHIWKKWDFFDSSKPLLPWINTIITHQITNLVRNVYGNYCRPCLKCAAAEPDEGCRIYGKQCSDCPLYARWVKTRKNAYNTKLPVALESHEQEVFNKAEDSIDVEKSAVLIHKKMKTVLKPFEWRVYECLFILHKSEEETAIIMGYKTNEPNRKIGYKSVSNIRKTIIKKVKELLQEGEVDIY